MNILHVTPHLGGGMGTVIMKYVEKDCRNNHHRIVCLDKNNNTDYLAFSEKTGVEVKDNLYNSSLGLSDVVAANDADIILIHWFNHPLLFELLVNRTIYSARIVIWNHVSGLYPPYVHSNRLIEYAERFIFTSPISYGCDEITSLPEHLREKLGVIWSTCGVEDFVTSSKPEHDEVIVGFTGTVDYGKLHHHFIDMCSKVTTPGVKFQVCSGDSQEHLKAEAERRGISDRFEFLGRVPEVKPYLQSFDIFGYPLHRKNFATCEQALGEAMMCGAVPVVLNNPAESYIVNHLVNGLVATSEEEYVKYIDLLCTDPVLRKTLSRNAMKKAAILYDADKTVTQWQQIFDEVICLPRRNYLWDNQYQHDPWMVYAVSMSSYGKIFVDYVFADIIGDNVLRSQAEQKIRGLYGTNPMFSSKNKGSVLQYYTFFKGDHYLGEWAKLVE